MNVLSAFALNAQDYIAVGSLNVQIFDNPTRQIFDLAQIKK